MAQGGCFAFVWNAVSAGFRERQLERLITVCPSTGLGRVLARLSTGFALTRKGSEPVRSSKERKERNAGWERKELTCKSDPSCLEVVVHKQSYALDRRSMRG